MSRSWWNLISALGCPPLWMPRMTNEQLCFLCLLVVLYVLTIDSVCHCVSPSIVTSLSHTIYHAASNINNTITICTTIVITITGTITITVTESWCFKHCEFDSLWGYEIVSIIPLLLANEYIHKVFCFLLLCVCVRRGWHNFTRWLHQDPGGNEGRVRAWPALHGRYDQKHLESHPHD